MTDNTQHTFLASPNRRYTYGDLQYYKRRFYTLLKQHAGKESGPVGLLAHSCDAMAFAIATCWQLHTPFVCFDPETPHQRLKEQIKTLAPRILWAEAKYLDHDLWPRIENIDAIRPPTILNQPTEVTSQPSHPPSKDPASVFGYFFTSGTTGRPKIVPLKRRQIYTAARASAQNLKPQPDTFWLLCMPLNHIGGVSVILRSLLYGSAVYRIDRFDEAKVARLLAKNSQVAVASLVPTMLHRLLSDSTFTTHPEFKAILLGGGPISPSILATCRDRNIPVIPSYGMTETCAQIAANPLLENTKQTPAWESVGKVFEPNVIEIRDGSYHKLDSNKSGSIWLKGPQLFDGYLNEKNSTTLDEQDWFNTGDFGRLDETGNLFIESRRTDRIVTGGENVAPHEVEEALKALSFIKDAAVAGLPDKQWGQIVAAAVVFKKGQTETAATIQNALKKKLEGYKVPKRIITVASIPRTQTGKVKRVEVLALFD